MMQRISDRKADVTVIGGGLAGLAASVHLARAGFEVVCVEPAMDSQQPVGESLDWSAPDLMKALGLPMEHLLAEQAGTYKKHVRLNLVDGTSRQYVPSEWLAQPPYNLELRTLHLNRIVFNDELRKIVLQEGVTILQDKVTEVERDGRRIKSVCTAGGIRIASPWFIDASGREAHLLPKLFQLKAFDYGPKKVAIWSYFKVAEAVEGTSLYAYALTPRYMEWIWEIPIGANEISVGYVATGESIKAQRHRGRSVEQIFRENLSRFPRFDALLAGTETIDASVKAFQCRVFSGVTGPNWLVIGESASMVDPMTANGVTAALRQASEASAVIVKSRNKRRLDVFQAAAYRARLVGVGRFFNCGIERVLYSGTIRSRVGALNAGDVYTIPAFLLNSLYSRVRPRGVIASFLFTSVLSLFRGLATLYGEFCEWTRASRGAMRTARLQDGCD